LGSIGRSSPDSPVEGADLVDSPESSSRSSYDTRLEAFVIEAAPVSFGERKVVPSLLRELKATEDRLRLWFGGRPGSTQLRPTTPVSP
jgi:hypothetical protein